MTRRRLSSLVRLARLVVAAIAAAWALPADAYPFMIQHGYSGCGECHVDPGGWGRGDGRRDPRRGYPLLTRPENPDTLEIPLVSDYHRCVAIRHQGRTHVFR